MDSVKSWIVAVGAVGVALATSVVSFAEDAESRFGSMFGASDSVSFVGGVSGGMNYFGGRHTMTATDPGELATLDPSDPTQYTILPAKHDAGKIQPLYGAFLGVHMRLDEKMFVGFEISGDFSKHDINYHLDVHPGQAYECFSVTKVTRDNMFAATLLFGVKISEGADVYFRAGGVMTKVREKMYLEYPGAAAVGVISSWTTKRSKNVDGFLLGVGLRGHINENIALRLEYNYVGLTLPSKEVYHPGIHDNGGGGGITDDNIYTKTKGKLTNQAVLASVEFSF